MNSRLRGRVPWWVRIGLKIVLSRLPVPYSLWKRLRLFEHGTMEQPAVAMGTLLQHARTAGMIDESCRPPRFVGRADFTMLEIGPGDSLASGIAAHALGARRSVLIDAGDYAKRDLRFCAAVAAYLETQGYAAPNAGAPASVDALLTACSVTYLTNGVDSLAALAPSSIDFCFSNAVMEHIPKGEFGRLARELKRVLRPNGACVHRVDFQDHLGGGLNNLRFSERTWEGPLFSKSGFYTNRIRPHAMVAAFEAAGLRCEVARILRWPSVPIARMSLDPSFRSSTDDELCIFGMDLRLHHVENFPLGALPLRERPGTRTHLAG
jgi:SAM-dependent methyltransferase